MWFVCVAHGTFLLNPKCLSLKAHIYLDVLSSGHTSQIEGVPTSLGIPNTHKPTIPTMALSFLHSHPGSTRQSHLRILLLPCPLHCHLLLFQSHPHSAPPLIWIIVITDTPMVQIDVSTTQIRCSKSRLWSNPHQLWKCQLGLTGQN